MIRKAKMGDVGRIAEILVYNNRRNYYPIFNDIVYSFQEFNVLDVSRQLEKNPDLLDKTYLFEDLVVKGFVTVRAQELCKLYVDSFFQNEGIGRELLRFAVEELHATHLWVLEKNTRALAFYRKYGFFPDGDKQLEEGTTEYLLHLTRT